MQKHIATDTKALTQLAADWMVTYIAGTLSAQDRFTIALSGGSTPKKLFQLLATPEYATKIEWSRLHFFWGDERFVPYSDERNNAKMAYDTLLQQVPVKPEQVHIIPTDTDPQEAARRYEKILHAYFDNTPHSFDLVMLGLGDNAHTLSLFPGYPEVILEENRWALAFFLTEQDMYRITLTAPVVNQAAAVMYLVSGADKAEAVQQIIERPFEPLVYPAQMIQPVPGELHWFLDEGAAGRLHKL